MSIFSPDLTYARLELPDPEILEGHHRVRWIDGLDGHLVNLRRTSDASIHLAEHLSQVDANTHVNPPAGESLAGKNSTPELKPAKTSTVDGAAHEGGKHYRFRGFFSGATPDERRGSSPAVNSMSLRRKSKATSSHMNSNAREPRLPQVGESYLPGLGDDDHLTSDPISAGVTSDAIFKQSRSYWINRSAEQRVDASGRPAGFHYRLMHGNNVIHSGFGADSRRSFLAIAAFLNGENTSASHDT